MRISDWSSDVCSSDLFVGALRSVAAEMTLDEMHEKRGGYVSAVEARAADALARNGLELESVAITDLDQTDLEFFNPANRFDAEGLTQLIEAIETRRKARNDIEQSRSEEHTSELQSLMRISYAVFCLKKKRTQ